jgi:germination protein M
MARRKKKKNNIFKSIFNLVLLIVLLFVIFFLIQKFILPIWQEEQISKKVPEEVEEIEKEPVAEVEEAEVTLYFSDESAQYLVPEPRKIALTDYPAKLAIEELIKGPENNNLYPTIPQTTKVNGLYVSDRIAYIDFSSEIIEDHPGGSTGELLTVYSVVMTLTSFPDIDKVQLLVDGNSGETLVGHVDTTIPLERDDQWLRR